MNTHYFLGIKIPNNLAVSIIEARERTNLHETHKILPVAEDLHITLFYLGQVEQKSLDQLIQSLDQNIDWKSFDLTTNGIAHFGNNLTPRVVYTALEESESLTCLQQKVVTIISNYIEIDNRKEFNAHITIAKKWASKGLLSMEGFRLERTNFRVADFSLFRVNPNNTPRYEEVRTMHSGGG